MITHPRLGLWSPVEKLKNLQILGLKTVQRPGTDLSRFALNHDYAFEIKVHHPSPELTPEACLGARLDLLISQDERHYQIPARITRVQTLEPQAQGASYLLGLASLLSLMDVKRYDRVFVKVSVIDILETLFAPYKSYFTVRYDFVKTYKVLDHLFQYKMSDLEFLQKLVNLWGLRFYFTNFDQTFYLCLRDKANSEEPRTPLNTAQLTLYQQKLGTSTTSYHSSHSFNPEPWTAAEVSQSPSASFGHFRAGDAPQDKAMGEALCGAHQAAIEATREQWQIETSQVLWPGLQIQQAEDTSLVVQSVEWLLAAGTGRFSCKARLQKPDAGQALTALDTATSPLLIGRVAPQARDLNSPYVYPIELENIITHPPGRALKAAQLSHLASAGASQGVSWPLQPGQKVLVGFADAFLSQLVILGALFDEVASNPVTRQNPELFLMRTPGGLEFSLDDSPRHSQIDFKLAQLDTGLRLKSSLPAQMAWDAPRGAIHLTARSASLKLKAQFTLQTERQSLLSETFASMTPTTQYCVRSDLRLKAGRDMIFEASNHCRVITHKDLLIQNHHNAHWQSRALVFRSAKNLSLQTARQVLITLDAKSEWQLRTPKALIASNSQTLSVHSQHSIEFNAPDIVMSGRSYLGSSASSGK